MRTELNRVTIADLHIDCRMIDRGFFDRRLSAYLQDSESKKRDMLLTTAAADSIALPEGDIVQQIKLATMVRTGDGRIARVVRDQASGQLAAAVYCTPDYAEVEIHLWSQRRHPVFSLTDYEYSYTGFAFSDRLMHLGGAVLHGSALAWRGQGIIFSANSGVGKSTHANLWKQRFGDDVTIINDDKPAIRFVDGRPYVFGTPWSGKTDLNHNVHTPLHAIVFIQRSETNWIERLGVRESIFLLSGQIERPYYDSELGKKTLERIEQLVMTVPVFKLHCTISQEAVDVAMDKIIGKRERQHEISGRV